MWPCPLATKIHVVGQFSSFEKKAFRAKTITNVIAKSDQQQLQQ
jgi:hypothetical protein